MKTDTLTKKTDEIALTCAFFMPFEQSFSFVRDSLKDVISKYSYKGDNEEKYNLKVKISDEEYTSDKSKIDHITTVIESCDFAIVDITGSRANVVWELGYCQALGKRVVIIKRDDDKSEIPFNILDREIMKYEFSSAGLEWFKVKVTVQLHELIKRIYEDKQTLLHDPEIKAYINTLREGLSKIDKDSLLRNLAKGEFQRLDRRIKSLQEGRMDLRNKKPLKEVIEHYTAYVSQLDQDGCTFDTITFPGFWKDITDEGTNFDYFYANISAVKRGTKIRRIFVVDQNDYWEDKVLMSVLKMHLKIITERKKTEQEKHQHRLEVKIFFSENLTNTLNEYPNLAIWSKEDQRLLFYPTQEKNDSSMKQTDFVYHKKSEYLELDKNQEEIRKKEELFEILWDKVECIELNDTHLNFPLIQKQVVLAKNKKNLEK
jgi:nucleoside 2-deoxyribosyltransferase